MGCFVRFLVFLIFWILVPKTIFGLRSCTVIAPEFVHSARKYSISIGLSNVNVQSSFEVVIESLEFKDTRLVTLQPNGVQIVDFQLPNLLKDEYVLHIKGESGIYVRQSTFLKLAIFKPIFDIQMDKYFYRRGETLHYRILCMNENLRPIVPEGSVDIRVTNNNLELILHFKNIKFINYVSQGEIYINSLEAHSTSSLGVMRLAIFKDSELLATQQFQIVNDKWKYREEVVERKLNTDKCQSSENSFNTMAISTLNPNGINASDFQVFLNRSDREKFLNLENLATFSINSSTSFNYFVYSIIGHGNVLHSERIQLPESTSMYKFPLKLTNMMAPLSKLIVYFVDANNNFHYDEVVFNVEARFENKISLSMPKGLVSNKKLELSIKTSPNSYVGLLAFEDRTCGHCSCQYESNLHVHSLLSKMGGEGLQRGELTGSIILTTAQSFQQKSQHFEKSWTVNEESTLMRTPSSLLGEMWFFAEIKNTSITTKDIVLSHNLPNQDKTWRITAFVLNEELGFGYTELEPTVNTTKSYNISIDLPDCIYADEIVSLPIRIINYLNEKMQISVELVKEDYEIELFPISASNVKYEKTIFVLPKNFADLKFVIRCRGEGLKELKFLFFSTAGNDQRIIPIEICSSWKVKKNLNFLIDMENFFANENEIRQKTFSLEIFTEQKETELVIYANILGPVFQYLNRIKFETEPRTAEQAASIMMMNWLSLSYLESTQQLTASLRTLIVRQMHRAFLMLLELRNDENGAFYNFPVRKAGDATIWITAYIIKCFKNIKEIITIDETLIQTALLFLASKQNDDGSFEEAGLSLNSLTTNQSISLTAQVLLVFLEHKNYHDSYKSLIDKSINFLMENLRKIDNLYSKAWAIYVLYATGFVDVTNQLQKLKKQFLKKSNEFKFWAEGRDNEVFNVVTTSLIMLIESEITADFKDNYKPTFKWLLEKGHIFDNHALYPMHSTALGLEAILAYTKVLDYTTNMDITLEYQGYFRMEHQNFDLQHNLTDKQQFKLQTNRGNVEILVAGEGYALAEVQLYSDLSTGYDSAPFEITISKPQTNFNQFVEFEICVKYEGYKAYADLTVLEIELPTGYKIKQDLLQEIMRQVESVKHFATNGRSTHLQVFFLGLERNVRHCVSLEIFPVHSIANHARVPVACFEYSDPTYRAMAFYQLESDICDLCKGEAECAKNCTLN